MSNRSRGYAYILEISMMERSHLPMHPHPHGIVVYPNRLKLLGFAVFSTMFFTATFSLRDPSNA